MKLAILSTLLAAVASAAPAPAAEAAPVADPAPAAAPVTSSKVFAIMTLRSASPIHFGQIDAAKGSILINRKNGSEATCPPGHNNDGWALFYVRDGQLFLYGDGKKENVQQLYVDRSGMGQGRFGYITGAQSPPRNAELKGFKVDKDGYLSFKDSGFIGCPGKGGAQAGGWSVWVDAGVANPGGNTGCLGFTPMTLPSNSQKPYKCQYSK